MLFELGHRLSKRYISSRCWHELSLVQAKCLQILTDARADLFYRSLPSVVVCRFQVKPILRCNNYYNAICSIATTGSFYESSVLIPILLSEIFSRYRVRHRKSVSETPSESSVQQNAHKAICVWRNVVCKKSLQRDLKYVDDDGTVELGLHVIYVWSSPNWTWSMEPETLLAGLLFYH